MYKIITLTALIILFSFAGMAHAEEGASIEIFVNDQKVEFEDLKPFIDDFDRTQVPIRFVSEKLGGDVTWNQEEKAATIQYRGETIRFFIGDNEYFVNNEIKQMNTFPLIVRDRTVVPIRYVSEILYLEINWDNDNRIVHLKSKNEEIQALKRVTQIEEVDDITMDFNNSLEDIYNELPGELEAFLDDGSEISLEITWSSADDNFGAREPGIYEFIGYVQKPDCYIELGNYEEISANIILEEREEREKIKELQEELEEIVEEAEEVDEKEYDDERAPLEERIDINDINYSKLNEAIFDFTNDAREEHGIDKVIYNDLLEEASTLHSEDMAKDDFFDHENHLDIDKKEPVDRASLVGIINPNIAENLAKFPVVDAIPEERLGEDMEFEITPDDEIYTYKNLAEDVVQGWLNSPGHMENLLHEEAVEVGIGSYIDKDEENEILSSIIITQKFQLLEDVEN